MQEFDKIITELKSADSVGTFTTKIQDKKVIKH